MKKPFKNVLLELHQELPHEMLRVGDVGHADANAAIETLKRYRVPLRIPEVVAREAYYILETMAREYVVEHWAWAVPSDEAIRRLVRYSPIVEIGAGRGYWARLASEAGADVVAYDSIPPKRRFFPVRRGGSNMARYHADRALFLCWPPYASPMASKCLANYAGSTVIFVGEGCTGSSHFHDTLQRRWEIVEVIHIPQWFGMHDRFYVFHRRSRNGKHGA